MRTFSIAGKVFPQSSAQLKALLPQAYEERLRPLCMCRQPAVAMYIARLEDQYVVKRMPLSGREHDPACPSYEPPYELSGLGPLVGKRSWGGVVGISNRGGLAFRFPLRGASSEHGGGNEH